MMYLIKLGQYRSVWNRVAILCILLLGCISTHAEGVTHEYFFKVKVVGSGKPVILIPGLMSGANVWHDTVKSLEQSYQFHIISIAGFAGVPSQGSSSLLKVKQQIIKYIKSNDLSQPAVVGHSLGGFMAFWLASDYPEQIGPIVSVDGLPFVGPVFTGSNQGTVESLASLTHQVQQMYLNMTPGEMAEQTRARVHTMASDAIAREQIVQMAADSDPKTTANAIQTMLKTDLRESLANIRHGVLLLGASGGFKNKAMQTRMASIYQEQLAKYPDAELQMNNHARHFIMFDDQEWMIDKISQFLEKHL